MARSSRTTWGESVLAIWGYRPRGRRDGKITSQTFRPEQPVAVLILQGANDPLVPYNGGDISLPGRHKRAGVIATDQAVTDELADQDPMDGCRRKRFTFAKG